MNFWRRMTMIIDGPLDDVEFGEDEDDDLEYDEEYYD